MKLLRNPAQYRKEKQERQQAPAKAAAEAEAQAARKKQDLTLLGVLIGIAGLFLLTGLFLMSAKNRAENISSALDPAQIEGLSVSDKEFNPNQGVKYVQIHEGHDRNVVVTQLGSTLPIISRFNLKTFTSKNYEVLGAAPWALTTNFEANIADPEIMRYLLSNDGMISSFLARPDVAPLLEDPQALLALVNDTQALSDFFESKVVKDVFANEQMVRQVAGSRFMSYLLISKAVKHFRDRPQEALQIIKGNPHLEALRQNPHVQKAILENPYLKKIASVLLAGTAAQPVDSSQTKVKKVK